MKFRFALQTNRENKIEKLYCLCNNKKKTNCSMSYVVTFSLNCHSSRLGNISGFQTNQIVKTKYKTKQNNDNKSMLCYKSNKKKKQTIKSEINQSSRILTTKTKKN